MYHNRYFGLMASFNPCLCTQFSNLKLAAISSSSSNDRPSKYAAYSG